MPRKNASTIAKQAFAERNLLDRMEAGLETKIGDKDINQLYKEKLSQKLDIDEGLSLTLKKIPKPRKVKTPPPPKVLTKKGKAGSENLSKYRQQVREALEVKKKVESKNTLIYDDESESEVDEDVVEPAIPEIAAPTVQQPQVIMPDMTKVYSEIDSLKKQNKALEERLLFRRDVLGVNDMRRNMLIKF